LPILDAAVRLAEQGYLTGGCKRNRDYLQGKVAVDQSISAGLVEVAFDPQTSGGLLIALPEKNAPALVKELRAQGVKAAAIIGHVTARRTARVRLV
jgi:selenide,water dikinase